MVKTVKISSFFFFNDFNTWFMLKNIIELICSFEICPRSSAG